MVEHVFTKTEADTKIKSIRVTEIFEIRVGSDTIWVRLNDDTIDNNLECKVDVGAKKIYIKITYKKNLVR